MKWTWNWLIVGIVMLVMVQGVSALPKAVAFTFDDAYPSQYTIALPIFNTTSVNGTVYVPTDWIGTSDKLTLANLTTMYGKGWDIGSHTSDHTYLDTLALADQKTRLSDATTQIDAWGFTRASHHVAYPGGVYDANTFTAMADTGMLTGRLAGASSVGGMYLSSNNYYEFGGVNYIDSEASANNLITSAPPQTVVIFVIHDLSALGDASHTNATALSEVINATKAAGVPIVTISELYNTYDWTPTPATTANFTATPITGTNPLSVTFTDTTGSNRILYSEHFENWTCISCTVTTDNIAAPDGTTTAEKINETTGTGGPYLSHTYPPTTSGVMTFSIYAKPYGRDWLRLRYGNLNTWFDITNGTVGTTQHDAATITSVGSGWYRLSVTTPSSLAAGVYGTYSMLATGDGVTSYTRDISKGVYLWGAQLENGTLTNYKVTNEFPITVPQSWLWDFGDGSTSTTQNPSHTYTSTGIFDITLIVTNGDGSDTELKSDYITVSSVSAMSPETGAATIVAALSLVGVMMISIGSMLIIGMFGRGGIMGRDGSATSPQGMTIGIIAIAIGAVLLFISYAILAPLFTVVGV